MKHRRAAALTALIATALLAACAHDGVMPGPDEGPPLPRLAGSHPTAPSAPAPQALPG